MGKLLLGAAAVVASLSLTAGVAAAQTTTVDTSGPDARVRVDSQNRHRVRVHNHNKVELKNDTKQHASSGDAKVSHNTTGGDAYSGDARNSARLDATATIDNTSSAGAVGGTGGEDVNIDVDTSGPGADVRVDSNNSSHVEVTNRNDVKVDNKVYQNAYSGDATVWGNTTGGDAVSGDASNSSSVKFDLTINN